MARMTGRGFLAIVVLAPVFIAVTALVALVAGAAAGWAGEAVFPEVFSRITGAVFGEPIPGWQFGAMLAFVGAFLRVSIPARK